MTDVCDLFGLIVCSVLFCWFAALFPGFFSIIYFCRSRLILLIELYHCFTIFHSPLCIRMSEFKRKITLFSQTKLSSLQPLLNQRNALLNRLIRGIHHIRFILPQIRK